MSIVLSGFKRLIDDYKSCPDFHDTYAKLKNETREVNGFVLHDEYLF